MSGEYAAELPDDLREWLQRRAEETGQDPSELLTRAIAAYQLIEADGDALHNGEVDTPVSFAAESTLTELDERVEALESEFEERAGILEADLEQRLDDVESEFDGKIEDVRDRVIQVKREADSKASADHTHEQLEEALDAATTAEETSRQLEERIDQVDRGFDNFEDILEYLTDTAEEVEQKLDVLGHVAIDLRDRVGQLEGERSATRLAEELKAEANRQGITTAKCGSCESKLQLSLLSTPHCPHCETAFRELEPAEGLFGSAYLRPGTQPALEGGPSGEPDSPEDLFAEYEPEDEATEGQ